MAPIRQEWLQAPVIKFATIDSTNNHAMSLIDADKAQPGLTITTLEQTAGKGQRGRTWADTTGQSLLMSIILKPHYGLDTQFIFSAGIAVAVAEALKELYNNSTITIKWPNDIIVNAKKAGGILIENVLRGSDWNYAVAGIGLNIRQHTFPESLPNATSLHIASGQLLDLDTVLTAVRTSVITFATQPPDSIETMRRYNQLLFRCNQQQQFAEGDQQWQAKVITAQPDGRLLLEKETGETTPYRHGSIEWVWQ